MTIEKIEASNEIVRDLDHACCLVGRTLWHFSKLEAAIDYGLRMFLSLEEDQGEIVAVNVDFVRKTKIVRAAIAGDQGSGAPEALKKIDAMFEEVRKLNDTRLVVAHSRFDVLHGAVAFKRATADAKLKRQDPNWSVEDFTKRYAKMDEVTEALVEAMKGLKPFRERQEEAKRDERQFLVFALGEDAALFMD